MQQTICDKCRKIIRSTKGYDLVLKNSDGTTRFDLCDDCVIVLKNFIYNNWGGST